MQRVGTCALDAYVPGGGFQVGSVHGGLGGTGLLRVNELADPDSYQVKAIRIFGTVLNVSCRQSLYEELVKVSGTSILLR